MTLHSTAELIKKGSIYSSIGLGVIILLVIFFRAGVFIKNIINPPRIEPANQAYGKLEPISFPPTTLTNKYTYSVETLTGELPNDFPDRLIVFPIINKEPNLLDLQNAKANIAKLGFVDNQGIILTEIPRGGTQYEWREQNGFQRQILYDIVSRNFTMTSQYLISNTVLRADSHPDETSGLSAAQEFLSSINALPSDLDIARTKSPDPAISYNTKPQLLHILGNNLVPATSLADTQVVRVDLYQKNITYTLTAGLNANLTKFQDFQLDLPIIYPHPPASTMNFLIASGDSGNEVVTALFTHQTINFNADKQATYPIKTAQEAFDELKAGKGYIGSYAGTAQDINITKVYVAYFAGERKQEYLQPVIVFEGDNGFFGFIPAIRDEALN